MLVSPFFQRRLLLAAALALPLGFASAAAQSVGPIRITAAQSMPTVPGQRNGGGFLTLVNSGAQDRIVAASSPACDHVELHTMSMENSVMRMREVQSIPVPAGQTLRMRPGAGYHLMLMDLKAPLQVGQTVPVTVKFEKAGSVTVDLKVEPRDKILGGAATMQHGAH